MELQLLSQMHLGGFMTLFLFYWGMHRGIEYALRRYGPESLRSPECAIVDSRSRRMLLSSTYMVLRGAFGVLLTFPSCLYAGATTSWSAGVPLSHAGALCVASQAVPWLGELPFQTEYSTELMLHHLFGVLLLCDFVFHPQYMPIRPLYLYLAAHLGDGAGVFARFLKNTGHRVQTSRLLWLTMLFMTGVHVWSKSGVVVWSMGRMFQTPYRISDWIVPFCGFFFVVYTLQNAHKNLVYLGLTKASDKGPRGLVLWNGWWFSRFNMTVVAATIGAFMLRPFLYGLALPHRLSTAEHTVLWAESFVSCALMVALAEVPVCLLALSPEDRGNVQRRGGLYLRLGSIAAAGLVFLTSIYEDIAPLNLLDSRLVSSWAALSFPMWTLAVRLAMWMAVGEERRGLTPATETKTDLTKADKLDDHRSKQHEPIPDPQDEADLKNQDAVDARHQLRGVLANILVLCAPLVFTTTYSRREWNHTILLSHTALLFLDDLRMALPGATARQGSLLPAMASLALVCSIAAHASASEPHRQPAMLHTALTAAAVSTVASRLVISSGGHSSGEKSASTTLVSRAKQGLRGKRRALLASRPVRALRSRMDVFGSVVLVTVQAVGLWECYMTDVFSHALARELGPGFENAKDVISSAPAVFGIVLSLFLSTVVAWLVW